MHRPLSRGLSLLSALVALGLLAGADAPPSSPTKPSANALVILSTTDVKGKTSPCGCSIPKGGLSRRASFIDSVRIESPLTLAVDNGNFVPEDELHRPVAWFMMDAMKIMKLDAVGVSPNDLRFGYALLQSEARRTALPLTSANLFDRRSRKTAFAPYLIKTVGKVKVGFFSLMPAAAEIGAARDSVRVEDPNAIALKLVPELRKKGATVVVLLSQLGKVESEDLVTSVPGIDAVVCGRNVPMLAKGRTVKSTVASYGGEQGQYVSRTILNLDAAGKATSGDNETFMLGPTVGENPEMQRLVKSFEDGLNEELRKNEKERAAAVELDKQKNADHFVGAELCGRCHQPEYEQWQTTSHSVAWSTLVAKQKDATPDCIPCHVVGYQQPGGFQTGSDAARLSNVQCENCHGMGTKHDAFASAAHTVGEETCVKCHQGDNDATWNWEKKFPLIAHGNTTGHTIQNKKVKEAIPAGRMGTAHGGQ
ncbi:MAG: hypothetical protein HOP12_01445 [Candidatus Eisenbacteria bacterium]|uniref:Cytochrome c-552/4 domain-containing protein n=1 Tax=Eiseniibacteriota bacterium TaxID=2212470 RepID=A0A849SBS0_UNCEI|nr:hypothetical protein [Candidatus Eisenbacteria bacterium]